MFSLKTQVNRADQPSCMKEEPLVKCPQFIADDLQSRRGEGVPPFKLVQLDWKVA